MVSFDDDDACWAKDLRRASWYWLLRVLQSDEPPPVLISGSSWELAIDGLRIELVAVVTADNGIGAGRSIFRSDYRRERRESSET